MVLGITPNTKFVYSLKRTVQYLLHGSLMFKKQYCMNIGWSKNFIEIRRQLR